MKQQNPAFKIQTTIPIVDADLLSILKKIGKNHVEELTPLVKSYLKDKYKVQPSNVLYAEDGSVAVVIDGRDGTRLTAEFQKLLGIDSVKKRTWRGLYDGIGEVLDKWRKKKKNVMTYEQLHEELLNLENDIGTSRFVRNGEELPMGKIIHCLTPSQLERRMKHQRNLRGVKTNPNDKTIRF